MRLLLIQEVIVINETEKHRWNRHRCLIDGVTTVHTKSLGRTNKNTKALFDADSVKAKQK